MKIHAKTTLHTLVTLLTSSGQTEMTDAEIAGWRERLPAIKNDLLKVMRLVVFTAHKKTQLRRILGQIRKESTLLLDLLYKNQPYPDRLTALCLEVSNCITEVITTQNKSYAKYLDPMEKMPAQLYRSAAGAIEEQVPKLVTAMGTYYTEKTLQALVVGKMSNLLKEETGSWQLIAYLGQLQTWIFDLCKGRPYVITECLKTLLMRCNFNSNGFIAYCKLCIADDMARQFDLPGKYDCLLMYRRELLSLTPRHKSTKYNPEQSGIKEVLLAYVNAELDAMEHKRKLLVPIPAIPAGLADSRLPLTVSVDVLAYLFRLLVTVGVVNDAKKNALHLFISKNFQTAGIGNNLLSVQSIESKYRQVVSHTATTVKSILLKMLKQLDHEFK